MLTILGLGLQKEHLTLEAMEALSEDARIVLRTGQCGATEYLRKKGIPFETLDALYQGAEDFDQLNEAIIRYVAGLKGNVVYGVPDIRDESVAGLLALHPDARMIPGVPLEGSLFAKTLGPTRLFAACDLDDAIVEAGEGALVREITSAPLASEVKLALMRRYPPETEVMLMQDGVTLPISLEDLDRQETYNHTSCAYVPPCPDLKGLDRLGMHELKRIAAILRGPDGCPWDREQTHEGLRPYVVEEAWEVSDAIEKADPDALCEELGDLLWQVFIHANVAEQYGEFDLDDITTGICRKMLRRHPHVFGGQKGRAPEEIWEEQKRREKGQKDGVEAVRAIASGLPALMRAQKMFKKLGVYRGGVSPSPEEERVLGEKLLELCREASLKGIDGEHALKKVLEELV